LEIDWKINGNRLEFGWKAIGKAMEASWNLIGKRLENDWRLNLNKFEFVDMSTFFYAKIVSGIIK